ncbi:uncharacterized protein SS50377_28804 [Spironucleus salmonicida]|nr:hypothetical protein SS50377_28804 [Spironucleus salmonicida]
MFIQQQTSIIDSILHVKQFQALSASENVASDLYTDVEEVQGLKNVIQSNLTQGKETVDNMNNELARQNGQIEDLQGRAKGVGSIFTKGGGLALKVAATENKHCLIQTAMIIVVIVSFIIIFVIKFTK